MSVQAIRVSFECYIQTSKDIREVDHISDGNGDMNNTNDIENLDLFALDEEMIFASIVRARINKKETIKVGAKDTSETGFIELPNPDRNVVLDPEHDV
jgi:hypothetical protein